MSRLTRYVNDPQDLFDPPKADRAWQYIVVHHSAHASGSYAQIDRDHRERLGTHGCGYHFVIGNGTESPDGQIEVAARWSNQMAGAHCRDADAPEINEYGIGICLIGNLDGAPPTERQIEALQSLVEYLKNHYGISESHIGTHAQFASSKTACPGHHFPKDALRKSTSRQPVAFLKTRWLER
jgi:N-acetyl-anhydromuramyl-L-alanine amidase AmpD